MKNHKKTQIIILISIMLFLFTSSFASAEQTTLIDDNTLVAWDMSSINPLDISSGGMHGSAVNNPVVIEGKFGDGVLFDGTDYITSVASAMPIKGAESRCMMVWARPYANITNQNEGMVMGWGTNTGQGRSILRLFPTGIGFWGNGADTSAGFTPTDEWIQMAFSYNSSDNLGKVFIDTELNSSAVIVLNTGNGGSSTFRAGFVDAQSWNFRGTLDEIIVKDVACTQEDLDFHFNNGIRISANKHRSNNEDNLESKMLLKYYPSSLLQEDSSYQAVGNIVGDFVSLNSQDPAIDLHWTSFGGQQGEQFLNFSDDGRFAEMDSFSVSVVVKTENVGNIRTVISNAPFGFGEGLWLMNMDSRSGNRKLNWDFCCVGSSVCSAISVAGQDDAYTNTPIMLTGVINRTAGTTFGYLYKNKTLIGTGSCSGTPKTQHDVYVGGRIGTFSATLKSFEGNLSGVYIINKSITRSDLTTLYNNFAHGDYLSNKTVSVLTDSIYSKLDWSTYNDLPTLGLDDISGNYGTVSGATSDATDFAIGNASASFDGADDLITYNVTGVDTLQANQNFTAGCWIKPTPADEGFQTFLARFDGTKGGSWYVAWEDGSDRIHAGYYYTAVPNEMTTQTTNIESQIEDGDFHHIVYKIITNGATTDGEIYVDGVLLANHGGVAKWDTPNTQLFEIGEREGATDFDGNVDDCFYTTEHLSSTEILHMFESREQLEGSPPTSDSTNPIIVNVELNNTVLRTGEQILVTINATDDTNLSACAIFDNSTGSFVEIASAVMDGTTDGCELTITAELGFVQLQAKVNDTIGNSVQSSLGDAGFSVSSEFIPSSVDGNYGVGTTQDSYMVFTGTGSTIDIISLLGKTPGTPTLDSSVTIWSLDGSGLPDTTLATFSPIGVSLWTASNTWTNHTGSFTTTNGVQYAINLQSNNTGGNSHQWGSRNADDYQLGNAGICDGSMGSCANQTGGFQDNGFQTYSAVAVPNSYTGTEITAPIVTTENPTPVNDSFVGFLPTLFNFTIVDPNLDSIVFTFNGVPETNTFVNDFGDSWTTTKVATGNSTYSLFVNDTFGNFFQSASATYEVDSTIPYIISTLPSTNNATKIDNSLDWNVLFVNNVNLTDIQANISFNGSQVFTHADNPFTVTHTYNDSVNTTNYDVGIHIATLFAEDFSTNTVNLQYEFVVCGDWTCTAFDTCQPDVGGGVVDCIAVSGSFGCEDEEYDGDYSEFQSSCNYCTAETVAVPSPNCIDFNQTIDYALTNNATCCQVTGNSTDCETPASTSQSCSYISQYSTSDLPLAVIDGVGTAGVEIVEELPVVVLVTVITAIVSMIGAFIIFI